MRIPRTTGPGAAAAAAAIALALAAALAPAADAAAPSDGPTTSGTVRPAAYPAGGSGDCAAHTPSTSPITSAADRVRAETINIQSNPRMSTSKVKADVARAVVQGTDVIFLQEIDPNYSDYTAAVKAATGTDRPGTWCYAATNREIPILFRVGGQSPWLYISAGSKLMHGGLKNVSPARYISWVILENKQNHARTAFMNTHMVSGAFTQGSTQLTWRNDRWHEHYNAERAQMLAFHDQGYGVVLGGDFNRSDTWSFGTGQYWITGHSAIDRIGYYPGPTEQGPSLLQDRVATGFNSDHDARIGYFSITQKAAASSATSSSVSTAAEPGYTKGGAADPDTVYSGGVYYTYSTKATVASGCAHAGSTFWVPLRATTSLDLSGACPVKDVMPGGPGKWAAGSSIVWAPSVVQFGGRWILYYGASKAGSANSSHPNGHVCLGKAYASAPNGPFTDAGEVACPADGRWALDPDAFVAGSNLYLVYRDDEQATGAETAISGVRMDANGAAVWSSRHTLLTSKDITWDTTGTPSGTHIVENPSMMYLNGAYRLFFSGNAWNSPRYAVGLAICGSSPVDDKCTISGTNAHPVYGYSASGLAPRALLPGDHPGPGGLSVFATPNGPAVVWHWYAGSSRPAMTGTLNGRYEVSPV